MKEDICAHVKVFGEKEFCETLFLFMLGFFPPLFNHERNTVGYILKT